MVCLSFNDRKYESPSITESLQGRSHTQGLWFKYLLWPFLLVFKYCMCLDVYLFFNLCNFWCLASLLVDLAIISSVGQFG
jgi:hypothetical protein